jgi:hypothetical protein
MSGSVNVSAESLALAFDRAAKHEANGFESAAAPGDAARQRFVSDLKSSIRQLARRRTGAGILDAVDDKTTSLAQSFLAEHGTELGARVEQGRDGFEAKFDTLDPGWVWSLRTWTLNFERHRFIDAAPGAQAIADDYRIAVLSDWGTGLYGAPACAESIENSSCDLVLHLGDVYYSGTSGEVGKRFLDIWPRHASAVSRALNGNHEMYSGGGAYFERILKDARFAQPASYFALHNEHWLLVGLDTAYDEHDLHGGQLAWLTALAAQFPLHRILLFSHHQPFSTYEGQGFALMQKLSPLLSVGRIASWYWGHEHSCLRYDLHPHWRMYGRCVGHSGFAYPRLVKDGRLARPGWVDFDSKLEMGVPGGQVLDGPNDHLETGGEAYGPNGYVTLELRGKRVLESYRVPSGRVIDEFEFGL